jgi:threonyl-tRNA synthetase
MGLPLWLPKGSDVRQNLINFLTGVLRKRGYKIVTTPHIGNVNLYKTSGHFEKYGADSFQPISTPQEGEQFMLKPMNCPHHCEIYNATPHSYKDLASTGWLSLEQSTDMSKAVNFMDLQG